MKKPKELRAQESPLGIDLIEIAYKGRKMIVAQNYLSFADEKRYYGRGLDSFRGTSYRPKIDFSDERVYFHSEALPRCTFRPALTHESIAIARNLGDSYYTSLYIELGVGYNTPEGVFVNMDEEDVFKRFNIPLEERTLYWTRDYHKIRREFYTARIRDNLLNMIDKAREVKGIYFIDDIVFVPHETYKKGWQNSEEFCAGGLARALEHTENDIAEDFKFFTSQKENFPEGVYVDSPHSGLGDEHVKDIIFTIKDEFTAFKNEEFKIDKYDDQRGWKAFGVAAHTWAKYEPVRYGILNK